MSCNHTSSRPPFDWPCLHCELSGAAILSSQGTILAVNEHLARILGYTVGELEGKPFEILCHPDETLAVREQLDHLNRDPDRSVNWESCFQTCDGGELNVLISAGYKTLGSQASYVLAIVQDFTETKRKNRQALERERQQRDLLIREIHHRIKNNLQGIAGLLHNQALQHPEAAEILEAPIRQINSIALTYGLRSRTDRDRVFLCDLTRIAVRAGNKSSHIPLAMDIPYYQSIEVDENEAVMIALVLNELICNAVKHSEPCASQVQVALKKEPGQAKVIISNPYEGPPLDLNLETGQGLGTGLQLIRSLLPHDGSARLKVHQENREMIAELILNPPLIQFVK
ncbi:MAG: sensor histidine kinase [Methylohalobius sp. ZOD2]|nr:PAS domain S-box protein [Methylothermaceae bacterium]